MSEKTTCLLECTYSVVVCTGTYQYVRPWYSRTALYHVVPVRTGTYQYVPICPILSRCTGFQMLFYLLVSVSFDSEDLKRLCALSPLGQKHTFWIWTGNLPIVQRNNLTTEPRLQIWHIKMRIIAIIKSIWKKKFTTRRTCWIAVWLLANSGAESHNEDKTWQL